MYEFLSGSEHFFDYTGRELAEYAALIGLPADICYDDRPFNVLSGGEKVKVRLLDIRLRRPTVILLDEPTSDLDIDTLVYIEEFINAATVPVLYISHDERLLKNTANTIIHLEQLRHKTVARHTISKTPYGEYYDARLSAISKQAKAARKEKQEFDKQQNPRLRKDGFTQEQLRLLPARERVQAVFRFLGGIFERTQERPSFCNVRLVAARREKVNRRLVHTQYVGVVLRHIEHVR
ncbi:hypothetical protein FACS1894133_7740 [Clostridia bacterium]|nr:hypothetical protein FACS1894133_7740 [Clostridia bacterium]